MGKQKRKGNSGEFLGGLVVRILSFLWIARAQVQFLVWELRSGKPVQRPKGKEKKKQSLFLIAAHSHQQFEDSRLLFSLSYVTTSLAWMSGCWFWNPES